MHFEFLDGPLLNGGYQVIHELFRMKEYDPVMGILFQDMIADGIQEMGFSQSHAAIEKKWIVVFGRRFGDGERGGLGQFVGAAFHKGVEGIFWVELLLLGQIRLIKYIHIRLSVPDFHILGFGMPDIRTKRAKRNYQQVYQHLWINKIIIEKQGVISNVE